ncbi:MAG: glycoside hydrolase [Anaerolineae bacterium]|nr:glycoside hydrolase [Anaerolineae bacterium]
MPFHAGTPYRQSLHRTFLGNQASPLLVSSRGRYVWSDEPLTFEFRDGCLLLDEYHSPIIQGEGYGNLRGAYLAAAERFFPPSGRIPHELSFLAPQYNTWIAMGKYPTQEKVLRYAEEILGNGMPPGVLIIDDFWYKNNGIWEWDPIAFPTPKAMIDQLHRQGFRIVLWVSPWVSADTRRFQRLASSRYLLFAADQAMGDETNPDPRFEEAPVIQRWWNGASAVLDLSNPTAFAWFQHELDRLVSEFGIDGFKFDGGDPSRYNATDISYAPRSPSGHCEDYGRIGLKYELSEYRACWKLGNQPLIQRVRDKGHSWGTGGLADTLPTSLAHGLMGYAFTCPDMVGGGELGSIPSKLDPELYIRWAQSGTFFPIVQYSVLPHRALDAEHLSIAHEFVSLRQKMGPEILKLALHAAKTGEPIMRHMAYVFPADHFEMVNDQFMLGDRYLIAPVLTKGQTSRTIRFPAGDWRGDDGSLVHGPCAVTVAVPLTRLPWYTLEA